MSHVDPIAGSGHCQQLMADSTQALRVLLAEDDDDHVVLTQRALRDYRRVIHLEVVRDGLEALVALESATPDVLLLDLHMPRMTGFEVVERLRADPRFVALPIVILSASVAHGDEIADRHGASAFLSKSSSLRAYAQRIASLLDRLVRPG